MLPYNENVIAIASTSSKWRLEIYDGFFDEYSNIFMSKEQCRLYRSRFGAWLSSAFRLLEIKYGQ